MSENTSNKEQSKKVTLVNRSKVDHPIPYKGSIIILPRSGKQLVLREHIDLNNLPTGVSYM